MFVFLDEIGDAGFKFDKGSSTHFVIALVLFHDEAAAEDTAAHIKQHRKKLNLRSEYEFKFNKQSDERRLSFLEAIKACPFSVRAMVVDKRKLHNVSSGLPDKLKRLS